MTAYYTFVSNFDVALTPATKALWESRAKRLKHIILPKKEDWKDNQRQLKDPHELNCTFDKTHYQRNQAYIKHTSWEDKRRARLVTQKDW